MWKKQIWEFVAIFIGHLHGTSLGSVLVRQCFNTIRWRPVCFREAFVEKTKEHERTEEMDELSVSSFSNNVLKMLVKASKVSYFWSTVSCVCLNGWTRNASGSFLLCKHVENGAAQVRSSLAVATHGAHMM